MQNKKQIILIILSIGAVISLYYGITAPPKSKYSTGRSARPVTQVARVEVAKRAIQAKRLGKKTTFVSWGRSPFVPKTAVEKGVTSFTLNGILWDETYPTAIINNDIVAVGDNIGKNTVVRIDANQVVLNDGIKDFTLRLEE